MKTLSRCACSFLIAAADAREFSLRKGEQDEYSDRYACEQEQISAVPAEIDEIAAEYAESDAADAVGRRLETCGTPPLRSVKVVDHDADHGRYEHRGRKAYDGGYHDELPVMRVQDRYEERGEAEHEHAGRYDAPL